MIVLALEASTSSAKAALYRTDMGLIGVHCTPYSHEICDTVTLDPAGVYNAVAESAKNIMEAYGIHDIDIIGLSSIWSHSILMLDSDREPIGRISTWANTDSAQTIEKYKKDESLLKWFYKRTGCPIHSIYTLWKWIHIKDNEPYNKGRYISTLPEYIFEKLTGKSYISQTTASAGGMLNIHSLKWDDEILKFAGIDESMLSALAEPELTMPLCEKAAAKLNLKSGIPVVVTGADGALNQIAAGGLNKGIMTISVGTSGAIRLSSDVPVIPEKPSTWCYYGAEGKRIIGGATSGAGNCVEWFTKRINPGNKGIKELDENIENGSFWDSPIFLPFLFGERCPGWDDKRQGGFYGLSGKYTDVHLYYSVLEGVLLNIYQCYNSLAEVIEKPEWIGISGGIEHSRAWLQMAADIFGMEIKSSNIKEASLIGAVMVALKAAGVLKSLHDIERTEGETYYPDLKKSEQRRERFKKYLKYYKIGEGFV